MQTAAISFSGRSASGATGSYRMLVAASGTSGERCNIRPRSPTAVGGRALPPALSLRVIAYRNRSNCLNLARELQRKQLVSDSILESWGEMGSLGKLRPIIDGGTNIR